MSECFAVITADAIDPARLLADTVSSSDGAALLFWGVVREQNDGRPVADLEYSAYAPMAEKEMLRIAEEARDRFGTGAIGVIHRTGLLAIGEASVAISVASPHRGEAYDASRYVIEQLKQRVPVWKREGYVDGEREWVPGFTPAVQEAR